jgi:hypothetical protein
MVFKDIVQNMRDILSRIQTDLNKAEGGNKAASQRVRTGTVKLEKVAKRYRKESIGAEKHIRSKRPAKKAGKAKTAPKAKAKAGKSKAKITKPKAMKSKGRSSSASVHARSLSVKRPTAKLPSAKRIRWS